MLIQAAQTHNPVQDNPTVHGNNAAVSNNKKTGVPDDLPPGLLEEKTRRQGNNQGGHPGPRQSA